MPLTQVMRELPFIYLKKNVFLNWNIVALQSCFFLLYSKVSQSKYTYIPSSLDLLPMQGHHIELSSLCYTVGALVICLIYGSCKSSQCQCQGGRLVWDELDWDRQMYQFPFVFSFSLSLVSSSLFWSPVPCCHLHQVSVLLPAFQLQHLYSLPEFISCLCGLLCCPQDSLVMLGN